MMDPSTQHLGVFTPLGYEVTLGIAACMLFIGFLLCYLGRKYVKFSLFVFGFIFGAFLMLWAIQNIPGIANETLLIISGISGIIFGSLCVCILRVGQAAIVGGCAFTLVIGFMNSGIANLIGSNLILWIMLFIVLLILSYIAYKAYEIVAAIATSISGALIIVVCGCFLLNIPFNVMKAVTDPKTILCPTFACAGFMIVWFLISLSGYLVQTRFFKKDKEDDGSNGSSIRNSYDDDFGIGESTSSKLYGRKKSLAKRKAIALKKLSQKAKAKGDRKKKQRTRRGKDGKSKKYKKLSLKNKDNDDEELDLV